MKNDIDISKLNIFELKAVGFDIRNEIDRLQNVLNIVVGQVNIKTQQETIPATPTAPTAPSSVSQYGIESGPEEKQD